MIECQRCKRRSQLPLCTTCADELHGMLTGLCEGQRLHGQHIEPGWLEYLEDAALGRTRLGVSERRSGDYTSPLLFSPNASQLLNDAHAMLLKWVEAINANTETLAIPGKESTA